MKKWWSQLRGKKTDKNTGKNVVLHMRGLSTKWIDFLFIGLMVFCLPIMFHLKLIIQLNASVSDLVIFIILFWVMTQRENRNLLMIVLQKYWLIILYFLLLIYACIVSMANYITNMYVDLPYGIAAILKLSVNFMYVVILLIFIEKYRDEIVLFLFRWWKRAAFMIALLCMLSMILFQLGIDNWLSLQGRAQATLNDPNLAALYLIVSFFVIALSSIYMQKRVIFNLPMLLVFLALILTASRGGILSFGLAIGMVLILSLFAGRIKELVLFSCSAVLLFAILLWINHSSEVLSFAMERVTSIGTEGDGTSYRLFLWESAVEMWQHNPFIGVGIGQFIPYSTEMFGFTFPNIPHNTYLSFLAETGIFGFVSFIWFPVHLVGKLVLGLVSTGAKKYFYILIGLLAIAIQGISINIENIRFIWLFLVIAYVLVQLEPGDTHKLEVNK
ncbi:O-antigen ligase family protein [Virgibacillus sp. FSP13]